MDKKKGLLNVSVSIGFKVLLLAINIVSRRFLIQYVGNEVNGLNSLYLSILDFLSVAELGVGSAITFCMYKPIVAGDTNKVSALYGLFTKLYILVGCIIFVCGCALMPVLPYLAKDYEKANVNLYLTYFVMLISVVLSYFFSAKSSLINAYKNNYITTIISSSGMLLQCCLQIAVLIFTKSFFWYLFCRVISIMLQWLVTEIIARNKYPMIIRNKQKIDSETKQEVTKNIKAMFMHRIGGVLVNAADSIIISAFIGVVILGKYSNYTTIVTAMMGILILCFTPLTSVIGHMTVEEDKITVRKYYNFFHTFNFILGIIFFLGYYAVIDDLILLFFAGNTENDLIMAKSVSFIITLNYFIQFMRQATTLFRDATGTFYYDRWKPLFEGLLNIVLSISFVYLFGYFFGDDLAVVGVIAATIITNLAICHIVEPYVLYKHTLMHSPKQYYVRNYLYIIIFTISLLLMHFCLIDIENVWLRLICNGAISLGFSFVICIFILLVNQDFRYYLKKLLQKNL